MIVIHRFDRRRNRDIIGSMIGIREINGRAGGVIICDVCSQPITEIGLGMIRYPPEIKEGESLPVTHCHKGDCDHKLTARDGQSNWQELGHYLLDTCHNSGLTQEKMPDIVETWNYLRENL